MIELLKGFPSNVVALSASGQVSKADYEKVVKGKARFVLGADGERIIADLGKISPSFVSFLRKYIAQIQ